MRIFPTEMDTEDPNILLGISVKNIELDYDDDEGLKKKSAMGISLSIVKANLMGYNGYNPDAA